MGRLRRDTSVRFHGRGGQGVVTSAELLAVAAFREGRYAQAIPNFGSERMGAPVVAFCRISERPIRTREPVAIPDVVVVSDLTLVHAVDLLAGLVDGGWVLLNTARIVDELGPLLGDDGKGRLKVAAVPATEIGRRCIGRPVPNAALLGALCALTDAVSLGSVSAALSDRFPGRVGEGNVAAATEGYRLFASDGQPLVAAAPGPETAVG